MKQRQLGPGGPQVSAIGLGGMYMSITGRPDEAQAIRAIHGALDAGITFVDTADVYCLDDSEIGHNERLIAKALRGRSETTIVATKGGLRRPKGDWTRDGSPEHLAAACEASLIALGVETIDLYQLHRLDPGTPIEETLEALDLLVGQGKVRYIGCSSTWAWKLMKSLAYSDAKGLARFVSMQNHYNLIYREEEREMLPLCLDQGVGVIPWSPLARGMLARAGESTARRSGDAELAGQLYDHPSDAAVVEANRRVAAARGISPAETALAWLLSRPGVTAPIVGATKVEHLDAAARALDLELTADEVKAMEAPYNPHAVRGWIRG